MTTETAQRGTDAARAWAMRRVAELARSYPTLPLVGGEPGSLDARDAAFAHALVDAVVRRWLTLSHVARWAAERSVDALEPNVRAAVFVGCAQLLLMDRVPAHAAVDESVRWMKSRRRSKGAGLVNAALRRVARITTDERRAAWEGARDAVPLDTGEARVLREAILPEGELSLLSVATSHPEALLRCWASQRSLREARRLAMHGLARPPVILNTSHARGDLPEPLRPHETPGHHVFTGSRAELTAFLAGRSDVWAQDPASSLAVERVADLRPRVVVDLCAGKGTKTRQLRRTFPDAQIVATDVHDGRRGELARVMQDVGGVEVVHPKELLDWSGRGDLILMDTPCSNTGVLARRPEAKYRFGEETLGSLVRAQRQIVVEGVRLLSESGTLVYSTCSLDERENEAQLAWAARQHALAPGRAHVRAPRGGPGDPPERYSDGSFAGVIG